MPDYCLFFLRNDDDISDGVERSCAADDAALEKARRSLPAPRWKCGSSHGASDRST